MQARWWGGWRQLGAATSWQAARWRLRAAQTCAQAPATGRRGLSSQAVNWWCPTLRFPAFDTVARVGQSVDREMGPAGHHRP